MQITSWIWKETSDINLWQLQLWQGTMFQVDDLIQGRICFFLNNQFSLQRGTILSFSVLSVWWPFYKLWNAQICDSSIYSLIFLPICKSQIFAQESYKLVDGHRKWWVIMWKRIKTSMNIQFSGNITEHLCMRSFQINYHCLF